MFEKFFGGNRNERPKEEPKPGKESKVAAQEGRQPVGFILDQQPGRTILYIPMELVHSAGGKDAITRRIFPGQFDGSLPAWTQPGEEHLAVECPGDPEAIERLKTAIKVAAESGQGGS